MIDSTRLWSRSIVLYRNFFDAQPDAPAFEDEDLVELLTSFPEPSCSTATCKGKDCSIKKAHLCWSPVVYAEGTTRGDANVLAVHYFVADLDGIAPAELEAVRERIAEFEYLIHSTHSHTPEAGSYRLVMPLSRPCTPAEWPTVHAGVVAALELPVDPACTPTPARIYACPDTRVEVPPFTAHRRGEPLDVEEALEAARLLGRAAPEPGTPSPTPPPTPYTAESYSLDALRAKLADVRRSKAGGDQREKLHADILGRILEGKPAAETGARDATLLKACGLLAYWLPAGTPWEVALEILRPSLMAMDTQPEGFDHWVDEVRDMYARQVESRTAADAKKAAENERFAAALRAIAGKPKRAAVELDKEAFPEGWEVLLIEGKGGPRACEHNVDLILACDPEVRDTLRWNDLTKAIEVRGGPFEGVPESCLDGKVAGWLQSERHVMAGEGLVGRSLLRVARENAYDPIGEYLGEIAWDGVPRIGTFLETYFGVNVEDPERAKYVRSVSRRWLISLVARGLRPGCKVDTVLILEGPQGAGKSSALEALVGSAWFLGTGLQLGDKDSMQAIAGAWLVELGELASLRRAETDRIKQFITSTTDKFRPPYGRVVESFPRRCVLVGTCNPEESGYLVDRTGNRRYWPVSVGEIDVEGIGRDRDLILAEAVQAFRAGERWHLTKDETRLAAEETEARLQESSVQEAIERWWYGEVPAKRPERFSILDAAELAMQVGPDRVTQTMRMEIGHALTRLGFIRKGRRRDYVATEGLIKAEQQIPAAKANTFVAAFKAKASA